MPSFDILSEVDEQEIDNALNQARKELVTRFDLKDAKTEIVQEKDKIVLLADDAAHLRALREIVIGKLSKRGVDLRNVKQDEPALSSVGHARQPRLWRRDKFQKLSRLAALHRRHDRNLIPRFQFVFAIDKIDAGADQNISIV